MALHHHNVANTLRVAATVKFCTRVIKRAHRADPELRRRKRAVTAARQAFDLAENDRQRADSAAAVSKALGKLLAHLNRPNQQLQ